MNLYRLARLVATGKALASGDPARVGRRGRNLRQCELRRRHERPVGLDILNECGTVMSATGRLLLEAAERAFRASGDTQ